MRFFLGLIAEWGVTGARIINDCLMLSVVVFEEGMVVIVCRFFFSDCDNSYKSFPNENYFKYCLF